MAALVNFHAWISLGVGIGKFLIDLGVRNVFDTKITWCGIVLTAGWFSGYFVVLYG